MGMRDGLACGLTDIDADSVAVRHALPFDETPNRRKKSPKGGLFFGRKGEKIRFVSPRNNQAMSSI
jgi:hypothetical protein